MCSHNQVIKLDADRWVCDDCGADAADFIHSPKLEELSNARLSLWRGHCGHHWIKAESETCPVCRLDRIKHVIERDVPDGQSQIAFEADCCRKVCDIIDPCVVEPK